MMISPLLILRRMRGWMALPDARNGHAETPDLLLEAFARSTIV
jgi:hypothetical protein